MHEIGIPQGKPSGVPLGCLELKPGQDLGGQVGRVHPKELIRQSQFPEEPDDKERHDDGAEEPGAKPGQWPIGITVVVFNHFHKQSS